MLRPTKNILLIVLFISMASSMASYHVCADELPSIFKTIPRVDSIVSEARSPIKARIRGLFNTYSYDLTESELNNGYEASISFRSQLEMRCGKTGIPKQGLVATIHYVVEKDEDLMREILTYIGCSRNEGIVEVIETNGQGLNPIPRDQLIRSLTVDSRSLELKDNEIRKFYGLYDLQNIELFTTLVEKQESGGASAKFHIRGIDFLSLILERAAIDVEIRLVYNFSPLFFSGKKESGSHGPRHYRFWHAEKDDDHLGHELQVEYRKRPSEHLKFLNSKKSTPISENQFQKEFTDSIINRSMVEVSEMIEYIIYTFPSVEERGVSKLKTARLIQELQNQIRLIDRRTNLDTVSEYLRSLINAIDNEAILIEDRRAKSK